MSVSSSQSLSQTTSQSVTSSLSQTASSSQSTSPSWTVTLSDSANTLSMPLTTSALPPTTTPVPTPTLTVPTSCPDCYNGTCVITEIERLPMCQCYSDFSRGFWVGGRKLGEPCVECQPFFYGDGCLRICPGGLCTPCSSHGYCDDGVIGTGLCTCYNGTEVQGVWAGDDCSRCAEGWYNATCSAQCQCSVHGTCNAGRKGNGTCVCSPRYTGDRCDQCAFGYYGPNCTACLPSADNPCNGAGTCDQDTGQCVCNIGWSGALCDVSCPLTCTCVGWPNCNNCQNCSGVGTCNGLTGLCNCPTLYRGSRCEMTCPDNAAGHVCNDHGTCNSAGVCECFSDATNGFWKLGSTALDNQICAECQDDYRGSPTCTKACPKRMATVGGVTKLWICSGAGVCSNGACFCDSSSCGETCEIAANTGECALPCASPNQWGASCSHVCTCVAGRGTCSAGRGGDGSCRCLGGFVGANCEIECDGNKPNPSLPGEFLPCNFNNGTCNPADGTCICNVGRAGRNCTIACPRNASGHICAGHGVCNDGAAGTGKCTCADGYVGTSTGCAYKCNCASSVAGTCDDFAVCQCTAFFSGVGCRDCAPQLSGETCETRCSPLYGTTNGTRCDCLPARGGAGCVRQCGSNELGTLCSGHGSCGYGDTNTGLCACAAGFLGAGCNCTDQLCKSRRSNSECNSTSGQCVCTFQYGGEFCTDCARTKWGAECTEVCSCEHGYCERLTGACHCDDDSQLGFWAGLLCTDCADGYFGADCTQRSVYSTQLPSFTVSVPPSVATYYAPQQSTRIIYTAGTHTVRSRIYTNANGTQVPTVVVNKGTLWTAGTVVAQLLDASKRIAGYRYFTQVKNLVACGSGSPLDMWSSRGRVFILTACLTPDGEFHETFVISSQVATAPVVGGIGNNTEMVASYRPGATRVFAAGLFFYRNVSGGIKYVKGMGILDTDARLEANGLPTWCVFNAITRGLVNRYFDVTCYTNFTVLGEPLAKSESNSLPLTFADTSVVLYAPYPNDRLIVLGVDASSFCVGYNFPIEGLSAVSANTFAPMDTIDAGQAGRCTSIKAGVILNGYLLLAIQRGGEARVTRTKLSFNGIRYSAAWETPKSEAPSSGHEAVAMAVDRLSDVVYLIINQKTTAYFVKVLATAGTFEVLGSQALDSTTTSDDRRASALALAEDARMVAILQRKAEGVVVRRYAVYDVTGVVPSFSDRRGGTLLTVIGRGFAPAANGGQPLVKIGVVTVDATIINETALTAIAPQTVAGECEQDAVAVAMAGDIFTVNKVYLDRYEPPSLKDATPNVQHYDSPSPVTLRGLGFFASQFITCRFARTLTAPPTTAPIVRRKVSHSRTKSSTRTIHTPSFTQSFTHGTPSQSASYSRSNYTFTPTPTIVPDTAAPTAVPTAAPPPSPQFRRAGLVEYLDQPGVYNATSDTVLCPPIANVHGAWRGTIDVAFDGSVFTGESRVIVLVGQAAGLSLSYQTVNLVADLAVPLPPLTVTFVDSAGNIVGDTFDANVIVTASMATGSDLALSPATVSIEALAGTPRVVFSNLMLRLPRSVTDRLIITVRHIFSAAPLDWSGVVNVEVTQGPLYSVVIVQQPDSTILLSQDANEGGKLINEKPSVDLQDIAGNRLGSSSTGMQAHAYVMETRVADVADVLLRGLGPRVPTKNFTAACLSGSCSFDLPIDRIFARGGFQYHFYIWVQGPDGSPVWTISNPMTPICTTGTSGGTYLKFGGYACSACMEHVSCLGGVTNELVLEPGYWRSSPYMWEIYQCNPEHACLGGNRSGACSPGYTGPRCGVCEAGYAKSIGNNCVPCSGPKTRLGLFVTILLLAFIFLVVSIVLSAQNWRVSSSAVVVLQLLVTHMQTVVSVGEIEAPYPDFFDEAIAWYGVLADLRVLDISFADCVLRGDGSNFLAKFGVFAMAPVIALVAAGVAWVILFVNPEFLRLSFTRAGGHTLSKTQQQFARRNLHQRRQRLAIEAKKMGRDPQEYVISQEGQAYSFEPIDGLEEDADNNHEAGDKVLRRSEFTFLATTAMQVVLFFMYPTAVAYALQMLGCISLTLGDGSTVSLLAVDMTVSCTDSTYIAFRRLAIAVAVLLLVGVPLGFAAGFVVHLRLRPFRRLERKQLFSFLLQGLKPRMWFWPSVLFVRKGLLKCVVVLLRNPADGWVASWLLMLYIPLLQFVRPYEDPLHGQLDALSVTADIVAVNAAFALTVTDQYYVRVLISSISMVVLVAVSVVCVWVSTEYPRFAFSVWFRSRILKRPVTQYEELDNEELAGVAKVASNGRGLPRGGGVLAVPVREGSEEAEEGAGEEGDNGDGSPAASAAGRPAAGRAAGRETSPWLLESLREHGYGQSSADQLARLLREHEEKAKAKQQREQQRSRSGGLKRSASAVKNNISFAFGGSDEGTADMERASAYAPPSTAAATTPRHGYRAPTSEADTEEPRVLRDLDEFEDWVDSNYNFRPVADDDGTAVTMEPAHAAAPRITPPVSTQPTSLAGRVGKAPQQQRQQPASTAESPSRRRRASTFEMRPQMSPAALAKQRRDEERQALTLSQFTAVAAAEVGRPIDHHTHEARRGRHHSHAAFADQDIDLDTL
jgi:hypothetical protein